MGQQSELSWRTSLRAVACRWQEQIKRQENHHRRTLPLQLPHAEKVNKTRLNVKTDRRVRIKSYRLFQKLGPKAASALGSLEKLLLKDERGYVRLAASKALRRIRASR